MGIKNRSMQSYPKSVVAQLEHRQFRQLVQIFDFRDFIGAQVQLFQFNQFVQVFNLCNPIKAEIQNSVMAMRMHESSSLCRSCMTKLTLNSPIDPNSRFQ